MIYVIALIVMALMRLLLPRDTLHSRRVFTCVSFLLLTFIAACRAPEVGRDTALFLDVFQKLHGRGFLDTLTFSSWVEPGFRVLCFVISRFTANGQWLIAITALLINGSVSLFIYRHAKNIYLAFYLYLAMMLYPFYLNIMRQALAIAILLFAWDFLKRRCYWRYTLVVLLAACFHVSALLFLLCPILTFIPIHKKSLKVLLPVTGVLAALGMAFVRPVLKLVTLLIPRYADYEPTSFGALYCFFSVFLIVTAYGIYRFYFAKDVGAVAVVKGEFDEHAFLTLMMLAGVVVAAMMTGFGQLQRIFNYFEVLYLLWLPAAVPAAYFHEEKRHIAFPVQEIAVLLAALSYFLIILFLRSALWYDALPYQFFWQ